MRKTVMMTVGMLILIALSGCATNPIVGHAGNHAGVYSGDVGITGYGTTLTLQAGSEVPKLAIVGDACTVYVDDGATVGRIEFWGNGNTVTIPENLKVAVAAMGTNKVNRRPVGQPAPPPANPTTRPSGG